jgi:hypothetical protein
MFEEIEVKQNDYLNSIKSELIELDKKTTEIKISNDNEFGIANDILKSVKLKIKTIEDRRKDIVAPLNDYVSLRNAEFKPFSKHLEDIKGKIESEIMRYNRERQEQLRIEAEQKRQEELKKLKEDEELQRMKAELTDNKIDIIKADVMAIKQKEIENSEIEIKNSFRTDTVNTIISENWDFEIINEKEVSLDFCSPDPKKIKLAIKNGQREMSGIRIFDKGKITSR